VIEEIENEGGIIFDRWRREIEVGFGIHWEDDMIYNFGESLVVCRCVEGVFVFDDDEGFGLARFDCEGRYGKGGRYLDRRCLRTA
jgi:hypothetical protein